MRDVTNWLNKKGLFWINIKTTGTWDASRGIYRPSPYTRKGVSDLLVIHQAHPVFIELKAAKGKQSPDQVLFEQEIKNEGCEYYVARSVKDIEKLFPL